MTQLFELRPEKRLAMVGADKHKWFKSHEAALAEMYERVVNRGVVLNPASDREIFEKYAGGSDNWASTNSETPGRLQREPLFMSSGRSLSTVGEDNEDIEDDDMACA